MLDNLTKTISANIDKDVSKIIHMSAVYVKIFLCEANAFNHEFHGDFNFIENLYNKFYYDY